MNFPMKPLFQSDLRAADIVLLPGMSRIIADSMLEPQDPTWVQVAEFELFLDQRGGSEAWTLSSLSP